MKTISRKQQHQKAVRTTITLAPVLFDATKELIRRGGFNGLSDYLQARIRKDAGLDA